MSKGISTLTYDEACKVIDQLETKDELIQFTEDHGIQFEKGVRYTVPQAKEKMKQHFKK